MILDTHRPLIVIADSDRTVLELLQIRLDLAGYRTCIARTGRAAIDALQHVRPSALLLDLRLAEVDGFEVLNSLSRRLERPSYPILVFGRNLQAEDIQRAISLGARDCMSKPFSGADVLDRVARLLRAPTASAPRRAISA